jgi:hypothetical protein
MAEITNGTPALLPRPDPTALTTDQLRREVQALRELMETRLDGMDKAATIAATALTQRVHDLNEMSEQRRLALQALTEEKFKGIELHIADRDKTIDQQFEDSYTGVTLRFQERDTRSERESRDNKIAVDAAFAAAKEAVAENNKSSALATDKSEAGFTKQYDQLALLIETRAKASDDKIDDIKEQLASQRGHATGSLDTRTFVFALLSLILAVITAAALIGAHL